MQLLIKILITIVISAISSFIVTKLKAFESVKISFIIMVITTMAVLISDELVNWADKLLNTPSIKISTQKTSSEINIDFKVKGEITQLSLNYPIHGIITNLQDLNSINEANTKTARVTGGTTRNDLQNILEISVENLKPDAHVTYKIHYKSHPTNIFIAGTDRYQYSYFWEHKGNKLYQSGWKMIIDDSETTAPEVTVVGTQIFNKALIPEEIKKMYEAGPPKRTIK